MLGVRGRWDLFGRRRRLDGSGRCCRCTRLGVVGGRRVRGLRNEYSSMVECATVTWGITLGERVNGIPNLGIYGIVRTENDDKGKSAESDERNDREDSDAFAKRSKPS